MDAAAARFLADLVLALHVGFAAFVVLGLAAILAGAALGWGAVRDPRFRALHLAAIVVVAAESWGGVVCPLTTLEMHLRERAGDATYSGAFVAHWLERVLYWRAPPWAFTVGYTLFGTAVVAGWWMVPPRPFRARSAADAAARPAAPPDGP